MLKWILVISLALFVLAPAVALANITRTESSLLRQINRVRAEHGLPPLRIDGNLQRAARAHTRQMVATNSFTHGAFAIRMRHFDVSGRVAGENLAWGTGPRGTASDIVRAWLASPGHRQNLLRPSYRRVGLGDLVAQFLGHSDARVVTADFAG